jgi:diguanylate cyclase (GGDEF)-like protein/PAS domain S-box-containing protein
MIGDDISRGLFDALPQFIAVVRYDGTLLVVNRPGLAFIRADAQDVIGKPLWDTPWWAHSIKLQEKLKSSIARAARGAFIRYQARHPDAQGREMVVDFSIKRIARQAGPGALVVEGRDITEREQLEQRLRSAASYARNLLESSLDPMMVIDLQGRIADVNKAAEQITGLPRDLLVGREWTDCIPQPEEMQEALRQVFERGQVRDCALFVRHENGSRTEVICNVTLYRDDAGVVQGVLAVARDITDRREYEARLEFHATRDLLTALPNRMLFRKRLERAAAQALRNEGSLAVVVVDINDFKDVNDTIGHAAGDEVLKAIAGRLGGVLRANDIAARIGGDKFAILLDGGMDARGIEDWAAMLLRALAPPHYVEGQEVTIDYSIGITLFPEDDRNADNLLRNADTAMHLAQQYGTSNVKYFTAEMNQAARRRVVISSSLRRALREEEFALHYQPRVALPDGAIAGLEALIRWNSAAIGQVPPSEFISIAESNGMIVEIGEWVLRTACRQARQWMDSGMPVTVAVNLSARQLRDADVVGTVLRALEESGLPPALLELELTESMLMHDAAGVLRTLTALKHAGVSLAIDDFGTGYSSLGYLKRFPLDYLKVDRSFVSDISHDTNDAAIVRTIIAMAHSLGIEVIAEGVETSAQLEFLQREGCDQVQGYFFSKPLPAEFVTPMLAAGRIEGAAGPASAQDLSLAG